MRQAQTAASEYRHISDARVFGVGTARRYKRARQFQAKHHISQSRDMMKFNYNIVDRARKTGI